MGKSVYEELLPLDPHLARYYLSLVKQRPGQKLTKKDAYEIFEGGLLDGDEITAEEVAALAVLVKRNQFDDEALAYLKKRTIETDVIFALIKGRTVKPLSGKALNPVFSALGMNNVGKIRFTNPVTLMSYNPCAYQVIVELVRTGEISVYEFEKGEDAGNYHSGLNALALFRDADPLEKIDTIVHEATHAVADWRNYDMSVRHGEADAFIAGEVAFRAVGGKRPKNGTGPASVAFHEAVPLVLSGAANSHKDKTWIAAYDKVAEAVGRNYRAAHESFDHKERTGIDEKSRMYEVWKSLKGTGACKVP